MQFREMRVKDVRLVIGEGMKDNRGWFARLFDVSEFARERLEAHVEQVSLSFNEKAGTLRGLHLQRNPFEEHKLVCCMHGSVFDVVVDLRPESPSYLQWDSVVLGGESCTAVYIPPGVAHGYLTLTDQSLLHYQISVPFHPESAMRVRWNDPVFGIDWPGPVVLMSDADAKCPDFVP